MYACHSSCTIFGSVSCLSMPTTRTLMHFYYNVYGAHLVPHSRLKQQQRRIIAFFLSPTQFSVACSTEKQGKPGKRF